MRNFITIVILFISYSVFCQNQESLLIRAYSKKSDTLLIAFLDTWQKEVKPNNVNRFNDTLKTVNNIIGEIYLNTESTPSFDKDKYILIDSRILTIEIAKEDSIVKGFIDRIYQLEKTLNTNHNEDSLYELLNYHFKYNIIKSYSFEHFNPSYGNDKVLYLDNNYNKILRNFLIRNDECKDRAEFLRRKIVLFFVDGRQFSTHDIINKVTLFISMKLAIVDWSSGYCAGRRCYHLNNDTWEYFYGISEICE